MKSYFYVIENNVNGKLYYGSGSKENYFGSGVALQNAIKKYGKENFIMTILREFETREDAFAFEDKFLKLYKISSLLNTYNLKDSAEGGDTFTNNPNKDMIREKRSNSMKGKNLGKKISDKHKETLRNLYLGSKNPEHSKKMTGKIHSDETKEKIRILHAGKNISQETRYKMSTAQKGKKLTSDHCQAISISKKGRTYTDEHKRNMAESHIKNKELMSKKIIQMSLDGTIIKVWDNYFDLKKAGYNHLYIMARCNSKKKIGLTQNYLWQWE
jgi:hypothetical protein